MLSPVRTVAAASVDYTAPAQQVASRPAAMPVQAPVMGDQAPSAAKLNLLSLSGQLQMARGSSVLAETIGALLQVPRGEDESLPDYMMRLQTAVQALSEDEGVNLERLLNQIVKGISVRLLDQILKDPAGPQAARLAMSMESAHLSDGDPAAKAAVSSYQQNAARPAPDASAQRPANPNGQMSQPGTSAAGASAAAGASTAPQTSVSAGPLPAAAVNAPEPADAFRPADREGLAGSTRPGTGMTSGPAAPDAGKALAPAAASLSPGPSHGADASGATSASTTLGQTSPGQTSPDQTSPGTAAGLADDTGLSTASQTPKPAAGHGITGLQQQPSTAGAAGLPASAAGIAAPSAPAQTVAGADRDLSDLQQPAAKATPALSPLSLPAGNLARPPSDTSSPASGSAAAADPAAAGRASPAPASSAPVATAASSSSIAASGAFSRPVEGQIASPLPPAPTVAATACSVSELLRQTVADGSTAEILRMTRSVMQQVTGLALTDLLASVLAAGLPDDDAEMPATAGLAAALLRSQTQRVEIPGAPPLGEPTGDTLSQQPSSDNQSAAAKAVLSSRADASVQTTSAALQTGASLLSADNALSKPPAAHAAHPAADAARPEQAAAAAMTLSAVLPREGFAFPYIPYPPAENEARREGRRAMPVEAVDEDGGEDQGQAGDQAFNHEDHGDEGSDGQKGAGQDEQTSAAARQEEEGQANELYWRMAGWS